jgi:hypothetical protein
MIICRGKDQQKYDETVMLDEHALVTLVYLNRHTHTKLIWLLQTQVVEIITEACSCSHLQNKPSLTCITTLTPHTHNTCIQTPTHSLSQSHFHNSNPIFPAQFTANTHTCNSPPPPNTHTQINNSTLKSQSFPYHCVLPNTPLSKSIQYTDIPHHNYWWLACEQGVKRWLCRVAQFNLEDNVKWQWCLDSTNTSWHKI